MIICPNCGTELADTARFCRICGLKLEVPEAETQVEAETEAAEAAEAMETATAQSGEEAPEAMEAVREETPDGVPESVEQDAPESMGMNAPQSRAAEDEPHEEFAEESEAVESYAEGGYSEAEYAGEEEYSEENVAEEYDDEDDDFEEPVVDEDGNVSFDWDQPVKVEMKEPRYGWDAPTAAPEGGDAAAMAPAVVDDPEGYDEEEYEEYDEAYGGEEATEWDHTWKFEERDISENKVVAMAAYVLGPIGIIIALLASQTSPFAGFHVRQALKFAVLQALVSIVMVLLCWTVIVPIAGGVFLVILLVLQVIAFIDVCKGRAVEPPLIRGIRFMK